MTGLGTRTRGADTRLLPQGERPRRPGVGALRTPPPGVEGMSLHWWRLPPASGTVAPDSLVSPTTPPTCD